MVEFGAGDLELLADLEGFLKAVVGVALVVYKRCGNIKKEWVSVIYLVHSRCDLTNVIR